MPTTNHVTANSGDVLILAGTTKGAFVLRSDHKESLETPVAEGSELTILPSVSGGAN